MAEFFYTDCLKKRSAVLGPLHPATLQTLCSIAAVQTSMVSCHLPCPTNVQYRI